MSNDTGRLILHEAVDPVTNMAIDEALARTCSEGGGGFPVIRFYWWNVPTLSLGAKERLHEAADIKACKEMGIALVRRPTGGRSVLHDKELTYAVIAPLGRPPFNTSVEQSYRMIAEAQARGISKLGIDLKLTAGGRKVRPRTAGAADSGAAFGAGAALPGAHLPCFAAPSRYELTWNGKKVIGSAQRRLKGSVLQHGSILLQGDVERLARATGAGSDGAQRLSTMLTGLEEIAGKEISRGDIAEVMGPELMEIFACQFEVSDLSRQEWQRVRELEPRIAAKLGN